MRVDTRDRRGAESRRIQLDAAPLTGLALEGEQLVADVFQFIEHNEMLRFTGCDQRFALGRFEQHLKLALAF